MEPSAQRQKELEPLSIHIYQQISVGYPMDQIRGQFEGTDLPPEDVAWALENGKQRYLGYQRFLLEANRDSAKWTMLGGLVMFGIVSLLLTTMGWSSAGRQNGMIYIGFIVGAGGFLYGVYCWLNAAPDGVRNDLD